MFLTTDHNENSMYRDNTLLWQRSGNSSIFSSGFDKWNDVIPRLLRYAIHDAFNKFPKE
jgi:hypothetical protein